MLFGFYYTNAVLIDFLKIIDKFKHVAEINEHKKLMENKVILYVIVLSIIFDVNTLVIVRIMLIISMTKLKNRNNRNR